MNPGYNTSDNDLVIHMLGKKDNQLADLLEAMEKINQLSIDMPDNATPMEAIQGATKYVEMVKRLSGKTLEQFKKGKRK